MPIYQADYIGHGVTLITPTADGAAGEPVITDGAGALSFAAGVVLTGGEIALADSKQVKLGDAQDYTTEWDGTDAVHTVTAGQFVFTGGRVEIVGVGGEFLRLRALSSTDIAGLTFYNRPSPNAASRQWKIASNTSTAGTLAFYRSTTASGEPTTYAVSLDALGVGIANDMGLFYSGAAGTTDYNWGWDGDDAVHTITAGSFVFTGGSIEVDERMTISGPTPILVLKDSTYAGDVSLGFIEWRDLNNTRLGFFGNSSSGNDDLLWKNESSGGHIGIQTTGGGEVQILANVDLDGMGLFRDKLKFTQDDGNEYIDSLNDGYMDYGATTAHRFNNIVVLPKASGQGIQVDTAAPAFGWRDLLGQIITKGVGASDPDWAVYRGSLRQYKFADGHVHEAWINYHIPHDYVLGTDLYIHVHWSQITVDTGGAAGAPGNVKWYFDFSYADGHGTPGGAADPFIAPLTQSVVQQGSTTQYGQMIAEVAITNDGGDGTHLDRATFLPDGVIQLRVYRSNADGADTLDVEPFVHFTDAHYQSTNIGTKAKAPDFYT